MALVVAGWVLFGLMAIGCGSLMPGACGFPAFWVGWAWMLAYLQVWHLFLPITAATLIIPSIVGGAGCLRARSRLARLPVTRLGDVILVLLMAVIAIGVANHALSPITNTYDAGLYHLSTINWENAYAIVPGLGNLQGRLAYNSSYFLYLALANTGSFKGHGWNVGTSLLLLVLAWQALVTMRNVIVRQVGPESVSVPLVAAVFGFVFMRYSVSTTSNDVAVAVLQAVVLVALVEFLSDKARTRQEDSRQIRTLALLAAAGIVVKTDVAAMMAASVALAGAVWVIRHRPEPGASVRMAMSVAAVMAALVVPWLLRSVLLSGYLIYPMLASRLPVPWAVPAAEAVHDYVGVVDWARAPGPGYLDATRNWGWLGPWWTVSAPALRTPLVLGGCCLAVGLLAAVRALRMRRVQILPVLTVLPILAGLVFWFVVAPDPRFVGILPWAMVVVPLAAVAAMYDVRRFSKTYAVLLAALAAGIFLSYPGADGGAWSVAAGPDRGFYPLPSPPLRTVRTASGITLDTPVQSDQQWESPLLTTPNPNTQLRLRCEGDLGCGFTANSFAILPISRQTPRHRSSPSPEKRERSVSVSLP